MSRLTNTELTDEHLRIFSFAYDYFCLNGVGPLYRSIRKHAGATKGDIERLFPNDLTSVYSWVGIPIHSPDDPCKPIVRVEINNFRQVYLDHNATTYLRDREFFSIILISMEMILLLISS